MRELNVDEQSRVGGGFGLNGGSGFGLDVDEIVVVGVRIGGPQADLAGIRLSGEFLGDVFGAYVQADFTQSAQSEEDGDEPKDEDENGIPDHIDDALQLLEEALQNDVENGDLSQQAKDDFMRAAQDALMEAYSDDLLEQLWEAREDLADIPDAVIEDMGDSFIDTLHYLDQQYDNVGSGVDQRIERLFTVPDKPGGPTPDHEGIPH